MGFDLSFERPTCLATLKSSDRTKLSVCGLQCIYIYIYIYMRVVQNVLCLIFFLWQQAIIFDKLQKLIQISVLNSVQVRPIQR